jgi:hypothetical protein
VNPGGIHPECIREGAQAFALEVRRSHAVRNLVVNYRCGTIRHAVISIGNLTGVMGFQRSKFLGCYPRLPNGNVKEGCSYGKLR